jgi:hypothetical protein
MQRVREYLEGAFAGVEGWCVPHLWQVIGPLRAWQAREGVEGPVTEIGVHHGKFLIPLVLTSGAPAHHLALDVWDLQRFNLDGSGAGNLAQFRANLMRAGIAPDQVDVERADSTRLTAADVERLRARPGAFTLFSVDGCHGVEHAANDIGLAMALTSPDGFVFVDDHTNHDWPGVAEAVARLYLLDTPRFVPLAVACNKLVLCHVGHQRALLDVLEAACGAVPGTVVKRVQRFGYETVNVNPDFASRAYLP